MPRELVLETLVTLKDILFPVDSDSQALLRTVVSKKSFDPGGLRVGTRPSTAFRIGCLLPILGRPAGRPL